MPAFLKIVLQNRVQTEFQDLQNLPVPKSKEERRNKKEVDWNENGRKINHFWKNHPNKKMSALYDDNDDGVQECWFRLKVWFEKRRDSTSVKDTDYYSATKNKGMPT